MHISIKIIVIIIINSRTKTSYAFEHMLFVTGSIFDAIEIVLNVKFCLDKRQHGTKIMLVNKAGKLMTAGDTSSLQPLSASTN